MDIKIFPVFPNMDDATCFYRGVVPMAELGHSFPIDVIYGAISNVSIYHSDIVFLQRPFTPEHMRAAQIAEKQGRAIWIDYDDDLFSVPEDNPAYNTYSNPEVQKIVTEIIGIADEVTVSTPVIANHLNDIRRIAGKKDCRVIPNALWDALIPKRRKEIQPKRPCIFWRGSQTHVDDLISITPELVSVLRDNPEWKMHFLGYSPRWIIKQLPKDQCFYHEAFDVLDYHTYLQEVQPSITVVPLSESEFNRGKSNIAWMELTWAHSMVLSPDFPEWRMPGCFNYQNPAEFEQKLRGMIALVDSQNAAKPSEKKQFRMGVDTSWKHIRDRLMLSQVNMARWSVIKSLIPPERLQTKDHDGAEEKFERGYFEHL